MAQFGYISKRGRAVPLILATGAGLVLAQLAHSTTAASAQVATSIKLNPVPATSVSGATVSFSATVTPAPLGTKGTGVTFMDNGNAILPQAAAGKTPSPLRPVSGGRASVSTSALTVGTHQIVAHFGGDANFGASDSAPQTITVSTAGSNVAGMNFSSSVGNATQGGTPITFTLTMTGKVGLPNPTGSVTFKNTNGTATTTLSAGRTLTNGSVTLPWPNGLPLGTNTVTATYSGDPSYASQSQSVTITVTPSQNDKFVMNLYTDMIGSQDPNGEAYWVSQLNKGMPRPQVAYAFTQTLAYDNAVVAQLYQSIMQRPAAADPLGANFWAGSLHGGNTPERVAASMTSSPEWYANFGKGTDDGWINACYQALLGRSDLGDPGAAYWHNFLASGGPRWQMTLDFVSGQEWADVTVKNMYTKFHLGTPDSGALNYWAGQVLAGMHDAQLAAQLTGSQQYWGYAQAH